MNIAIGIITKNRPNKLYRLLYSLKKQLKKNHKVFIVENGSNFVSKNKIRKIGIQKFSLEKKEIGNIPCSRNFLLSKVEKKYEILLFIDDDCIASENWLQEYENIFKNYKINVVQGKIKNIPSNNIFAKLSCLLFKLWFSKNTQNNITKIVDTKNVGVRLNLGKKIVFDEKLSYATDIDLAKKLNSINIKINYFDSSLVFQEEKSDTIEFIKHRMRLSSAYRNISNKYKGHFKSASIIEKYSYIWKNLNINAAIKIYLLLVLCIAYLLTIPKYFFKNSA